MSGRLKMFRCAAELFYIFLCRFANSLPINDPLQTVYQLMSGRMPASATVCNRLCIRFHSVSLRIRPPSRRISVLPLQCCGEEKWGDWRPHLAMVLSNLTHSQDLDTRTISTMGDTLGTHQSSLPQSSSRLPRCFSTIILFLWQHPRG